MIDLIKHIVMWKFHENAHGKTKKENIEIAGGMLTALKEKIDVLKSIEFHANVGSDKNFDAVLITTFENLEDLQKYAVHPEHVKVGEYISVAASARSAVDFEL